MNYNNMMNPFAAFTGNSNPFAAFMTPQQNPFAMWQDMMQQATKTMTNMCGMAAPAKATAEPFAFSPMMQMNPMAAMQPMIQQGMEFWQNLLNPTAKKADTTGFAPKMSVMTVELGDMSPYIKQATEFMSQWQNMWLQNVGGNK